jgi:beta-N-acetylhexosaminidase
VALLSHQAATTATGATTAQRLRDALGERLVALFGPEHGYFGQAGAGVKMAGATHPEWGIPVYSLYGEHRKPAPEMLSELDVVVVDFQDLGARCYTYLATLRRMMEAVDEAGLAVVVADRPVPLPRTVDGPPLDPQYRSFVADAPVPLAYGMTPGETARWLKATLGLRLDLRVAACSAWRRQPHRLPDAPEWVPPSPGIRTWDTAQTYLATVFTEALPTVDCGRATNLAFRVLGAPWIVAAPACAALNALALDGVRFHPHRYVAGVGTYEGTELDGIRISVTDALRFRPVTTSVAILDTVGRVFGRDALWHSAGYRSDFLDKLYGSDLTRCALEGGTPWREIAASWEPSLAAYRETREPALLYRPR